MALSNEGYKGRQDIYLGPPRPIEKPTSIVGSLAKDMARDGASGKNLGHCTESQVKKMTGDGIFRRMFV
jgi:hypothetical protein